MKYVVCEIVRHYHEIDINDDEIDPVDLVEQAKSRANKDNFGYESLKEVLKFYKEKYGLDYEVKPNFCGTEMEDMFIEI